VRSDLSAALGEGRGVTAKIRWLARPDEDGEGDGRPRWIHCTPLLGHSGAVGVWMIVLVDEENSREQIGTNRRFRAAPPVSNNIGGKEWAGAREQEERDRRLLNAYDVDSQRRGGNGGTASRATSRSRDQSYNMPHTMHGAAAPADIAGPGTSRGQSATRRAPNFSIAGGHVAGQYQASSGRPINTRTNTGSTSTSRDFAF
jgi:hypothetical protein